ncbi:LamG domain-containing protein [bacterium]|nr:LamG domain-containing protein [bacterium]MDB9900061.1 LamG domain-containing protein [bacterium]
MPNKFKHNPTGKELDSLFIGQWAINNSAQHIGGGPSSNTALFTGADIPEGSWALYHEGSVFVTASEDDLIGRANELGASALGINDALEWASTHEEVVILNKDYENIATDGLVLNLDANHVASFVDNQPTINYLAAGLNNRNLIQGNYWNGAATPFVKTSHLGTPIFKYNTAGTSYIYSHDNVLDDDRVTLSGQTVTWSMYIRRPEGAATARIRMYDNISGYSYKSINVTTSFQRFEQTKTLGVSPERIFVMLDKTGGGTYEFHSPQVEIGQSATPFIEGSRDQTTVWRDISGKGNDFNLSAGVVLDENSVGFPMKSGSGGTNLALQGTSELTIDTWFYYSDGGTHTGCCDTMFGRYDFRTFIISNNLYTMISFNNNGSRQYQHPNIGVTPNRWHHHVGMRRGGRFIIWLNGEERYNTSYGDNLPLYATAGGFNIGQGRHPDLKIGAARVWDRGLSDAEILQTFNAQKEKYGL